MKPLYFVSWRFLDARTIFFKIQKLTSDLNTSLFKKSLLLHYKKLGVRRNMWNLEIL